MNSKNGRLMGNPKKENKPLKVMLKKLRYLNKNNTRRFTKTEET
jgi:hypothetical protein